MRRALMWLNLHGCEGQNFSEAKREHFLTQTKNMPSALKTRTQQSCIFGNVNTCSDILDQNIEVNQKTNGLSQRDMGDAFKQFLIEELALLVSWILSTIKRGSMQIKSAKFGVDTKKFSPT